MQQNAFLHPVFFHCFSMTSLPVCNGTKLLLSCFMPCNTIVFLHLNWCMTGQRPTSNRLCCHILHAAIIRLEVDNGCMFLTPSRKLSYVLLKKWLRNFEALI